MVRQCQIFFRLNKVFFSIVFLYINLNINLIIFMGVFFNKKKIFRVFFFYVKFLYFSKELDLLVILVLLQNLFECFISRILFYFLVIVLWILFFIFFVGCNIIFYKLCWDKMELGKLNIYDISLFKNLCGYVFIIC